MQRTGTRRVASNSYMLIHYYVSGHGFGHATRVAEVCRGLLLRDHKVVVTTSAPAHLFPEGCRLRSIGEVDAPIVQPLPYEIDAVASLDRLQSYLGDDFGASWIERELAYNEAEEVDAILFDAPFLAGRLATPERPALLVSNFAFDAIYRGLLPALPTDRRDELEQLMPIIDRSYAASTGVVLLPGAIHMPFTDLWDDKCSRIFAAPLVYRHPRRSRADLRRELGIDPRAKVVLVQFGGHASTSSAATDLADDGVTLGTASSADVCIPSDFYMPDAVAAADAVLGKIGYGTVSECVGIGTPLVYVKRPGFAEEPGLIQYLEQQHLGLELSREDYETGRWRAALERAASLTTSSLGSPPPPPAPLSVAQSDMPTAADLILDKITAFQNRRAS